MLGAELRPTSMQLHSLNDAPETTRTSNYRREVGEDPGKDKFFFSPKDFKVRLWEEFAIAVLTIATILNTFQASFTSEWLFLWVIVYLADVVFVLDTAKRLLQAYEVNGILIHDRATTKEIYIESPAFLLDCISIFPTDLVVLAVKTDGPFRLLTLLRLNRVIQAHRILSHFSLREDELGANNTLVRGLKYAAICIVSSHISSCAWYSLACTGLYDGQPATCDFNTWVGHSSLGGLNMSDADPLSAYACSVYWAMATATSVGYGDISAQTYGEKAFSIVAMLMGVLCFIGILLGGMTSMLTNLGVKRARYAHRLYVIKDHLQDRQVPAELTKSVVSYYDYLWVRKRGLHDDGMFNSLPITFQEEISLTVNKRILDKAPLFRGLSVGFLRMLSMNIKPQFFLPNQIICTRGEIGHKMFYIQRGQVEILGDDDDSSIATFHRGRLFGEISLVHSLPRTATVRAATHCDLMVLDKADVSKILMLHPGTSMQLQELARRRIETASGGPTPRDAGVVVPSSGTSEKRQSIVPGAALMQRRSSTTNRSSTRYARKRSIWDYPAAHQKVETPSHHTPDGAMHAARRATLVQPRGGGKLPPIRDRKMSIFEAGNTIVGHVGPSRLPGQGPSPGGRKQSVKRRESVMMNNGLEVHYQPAVLEQEEVEVKTSSVVGCYAVVGRALKSLSDTLVHPKSPFSNNWQRFHMAVILVQCFWNSYVAAFSATGTNGGYANTSYGAILLAFACCMDAIYLAEIAIKFKTAVHTPNGLVKDSPSIVKAYLHGNFFSDLVSVLPVELFCLFWSDSSRWMAFSYLRLNRMIRVKKVTNFLRHVDDNLDQDMMTWTIIKFAIYISLLSHWCSCLWFFASYPAGQSVPGTWRDYLPPSDDYALWYVRSLYWAAATMTSTGFGDIHAFSTAGRVVAVLTMVTGLLLFGYCLSALAAALTNLDSAKVNFQSKLFAVKEFMIQNKLNEKVQSRVIDYLVQLWRKHRGEWAPGSKPLMSDMPLALQKDVVYDDAIDLLGKVPLFQDTDETFLTTLALRCQAYLFTPGDIIIYSGDVGKEMYIIRRGTCQIMSPDLRRVYTELGPSQYFGEVGLVFSSQRTATVQAVTYCDILMLTKTDLDDVLKQFPNVAAQFEGLDTEKEEYIHLQKDISKKILDRGSRERLGSLHEIITKHGALSGLHRKSPIKERPFSDSVKYFDTSMGTMASREYLRPFAKLNFIQRLFSLLLLTKVLLPDGKFLKSWTTVRVGIVFVLCITIPLQTAFLQKSTTIWTINYILEVVCIFDMYLSLHISYYNDENVLVTHPLSTAKHYFNTNFLIDLLAVFPIEFILYAVFPIVDNDTVQLFALVRLNRMIQFYRLPMAFSYLESRVDKETGLLREIKFCFYVVLFINLVTCALFMVACPPSMLTVGTDFIITPAGHTCMAQNWITASGFDLANSTVGFCYVVSFYWTVATSASVGYGEICATTESVTEMLMSLSAMIIGVLFFGYIIAAVAASLANADAQRAQFQRKLRLIRKFLKDESVRPALGRRVIQHYEYIWVRTKGVDPDSLFDGLPLSLWGDVTYSLYKEIISEVSLFQNTEVSFMKMLSRCIKPLFYLKGEYIVRKGDIGSEMFFIHRGAVDIVSEDGKIVFHTLKAGTFFGEIGLLFSCPRTASVRAQTNCDIFILTKHDLDNVLTFYPVIKEQVVAIAEERRRASAGPAPQAAATPSDAGQALQIESRSIVAATRSVLGENAARIVETAEEDETDVGPIIQVFGPDEEGNENETNNAADLDEESDSETDDGVETMSAAAKRAKTKTKTKHVARAKTNTKAKPKATSVAKAKPKSVATAKTRTKTIGPSKGDPEKQSAENAGHEPVTNFWEALSSWNRFTIDPNSVFCRKVALLASMIGLMTGWTIFYEAAYQDHMLEILVFNYVAEAFFLVHMFINFHTSFYDAYGDLVEDFHDVYLNYLKRPTGFKLDALANLPLDVLCFAAPYGHRLEALSYIRLIHLLRLYNSLGFFDKWEQELNANVLVVRVCKSLTQLALVIHCFAGFWYLVACPGGVCFEGTTWMTEYNGLNSGITQFEVYCDCVYWTVATMTSTGYGDIHAYSMIEMAYAPVVMIAGKLMFGFILGSIASTLANEESDRVEYVERLEGIKAHVDDQDVPRRLKDKIIDYFDFQWKRNEGENMKLMLRDAPATLFAELYHSLTGEMISQITILDEVMAEEGFVRLLAQKFETVCYLADDYIALLGDAGHDMVFLQKGEIEVLCSDKPPVVCGVMREGDTYGEINLVNSTPHTVSLRAKTPVQLTTLSQEALNEALAGFAEVQAKVMLAGTSRFGKEAVDQGMKRVHSSRRASRRVD